MCVDAANCGGYCPECRHEERVRHKAEIARLTRELEEARAQLARCGKENCMGYREGDFAMWVREERLLKAQRERDVARQALEVERAECERLRHDIARQAAALSEANTEGESLRARVAELEGALNQIRLILAKPAPDPGCHSWERFGQHMLTASRESEVIAYRALAAEGGSRE